MRRDEILALCQEEEQAAFHGWDFSRVTQTKRIKTDPLPWDYREIVMQNIKSAKAFVDMGTGGGEFLASLGNLPIHSFATEAYAPNIEIARRRLSVLGAKIVPVEKQQDLPFQDNYFHLIANRHAAYDEVEVFRAARPGGLFITQQVTGTDSIEVNQHLELKRPPDMLHWNLEYAAEQLKRVGFHIVEAEEANPEQRFYDVGAVTYFAKCIPWQFPEFSVARRANALCALHRHIETHGFLRAHAPRFLIIAQKP